MNIITASEFRNNQREYVDIAEKELVCITRSGKTAIALTPVNLDNYPTEKELKSIKEGMDEYEKGNYTVIEDTKNIWENIL